MLPKDYQEEILKMGSGDSKLEYEKVKTYVLSLAQQRASSMMPKQSDILGVPVEAQEEEESPQEYSTEEWINYIWELQVGGVQNPNVQCWTCGQMGHLGRNCP
eukprot:10214843-Karenia_brevis.AAC.1